jgi:hypothetical protein
MPIKSAWRLESDRGDMSFCSIRFSTFRLSIARQDFPRSYLLLPLSRLDIEHMVPTEKLAFCRQVMYLFWYMSDGRK